MYEVLKKRVEEEFCEAPIKRKIALDLIEALNNGIKSPRGGLWKIYTIGDPKPYWYRHTREILRRVPMLAYMLDIDIDASRIKDDDLNEILLEIKTEIKELKKHKFNESVAQIIFNDIVELTTNMYIFRKGNIVIFYYIDKNNHKDNAYVVIVSNRKRARTLISITKQIIINLLDYRPFNIDKFIEFIKETTGAIVKKIEID
ncbi:MAG: hypothetical protein QXK54_04315 [Ignisphaera sp.]